MHLTMTLRMTKCKRIFNTELKPGDVITVPTPIAIRLRRENHANHILSKHWRPRYGEQPKVYDFTHQAVPVRAGGSP